MLALFWLLVLVPLILGLALQSRLRSVLARYRAVRNRAGVTGAEAARALLLANRLGDVRLELAPGALTDHYDGAARALRLSGPVAHERSVAALGIAAHEVAHAVQDASGSRLYRARQAVGTPLAQLSPFAGLVFIGGFWLGIPALMGLSIAFAAGVALFALVTLPVEIGASRHALRMVLAAGLADAAEAEGIRRVLRSAAATYVVNVLRQLGFLLALVLLAEVMRRLAT